VKSGHVASAAMDVFSEGAAHGQSHAGRAQHRRHPHLGASTEEAQVNVADVVAKQIVDALRAAHRQRRQHRQHQRGTVERHPALLRPGRRLGAFAAHTWAAS